LDNKNGKTARSAQIALDACGEKDNGNRAQNCSGAKTGAGGDLGGRRHIVLTGGGSAGHVIPNLTLLPGLLADGWDVHYIGSRGGVEAQLARDGKIAYHAIPTGKLRRYFDLKNVTDIFKVIGGTVRSCMLLTRIKPGIVFSKGGFVAVPVVLAARFLRIPAIIHESDLTPGLANKICAPFASRICTSFRQTADYMPDSVKSKCLYTGAPVRHELALGDAAEGRRLCGFPSSSKPNILVCGGSLGARSINALVRSVLEELLASYNVIHICGSGNIDGSLARLEGYAQFEYVTLEQPHIYKIADFAVSRAGANSINELLQLRIPSVLIPLPMSVSRGDQINNASEFEGKGYCIKLEERQITSGRVLLDAIARLRAGRDRYVGAMEGAAEEPDANLAILGVLAEAAQKRRR
jgi:UDP-N-acetylglucosamine--N-acetylmuramyl-(pentapeptide) pyrophosphoryl-undecaprenol N-acetylglucosamine transferase